MLYIKLTACERQIGRVPICTIKTGCIGFVRPPFIAGKLPHRFVHPVCYEVRGDSFSARQTAVPIHDVHDVVAVEAVEPEPLRDISMLKPTWQEHAQLDESDILSSSQ